MNFDLFIFTAILLSRNIYTKYVGYSRFFGSGKAWFSVRKKATRSEVKKISWKDALDKFFILNLALAIMFILMMVVGWRLFSVNTIHNFLCLFYP